MTSLEISDKAANAEERWLREIAFQLAILNEANQYKEHAQRLLDENTELRNDCLGLDAELRNEPWGLADPEASKEDAGGQRGEPRISPAGLRHLYEQAIRQRDGLRRELKMAKDRIAEPVQPQRGQHEWSDRERAEVQYCLRCGRSREYAEGGKCGPIRSVAELVLPEKDAGGQRGETGDADLAAKFPHKWVIQHCTECGHIRKFAESHPCAALMRRAAGKGTPKEA